MMSPEKGPVIRVVFAYDTKNSTWVAHCLEHPIFAEASSFRDVERKFDRMVLAHIEHRISQGQTPFSDRSDRARAPDCIWELWRRAAPCRFERIMRPARNEAGGTREGHYQSLLGLP